MTHRLCYIDPPFAYFTSNPLDEEWGDDWDDAPYDCNAGEPYGEGGEIVIVAYKSAFMTPSEREYGWPISVEDINMRREQPWLMCPPWKGEHSSIWAGTELEEFCRMIRATGGRIWKEER